MFVLVECEKVKFDKFWDVFYEYFPNQEDSIGNIYPSLICIILDTGKNKIIYRKGLGMMDLSLPIISHTEKSIIYGVDDIPIIEIFVNEEMYYNTINFKEYRRKKLINNLDI